MSTQHSYEAMFILRAVGSEQEVNQSAARVEESIKKLGAHVEASQALGRRKLAYRIHRQTEGYYHVVRFSAPTEQVREMERLLSLEESILRFLILSEDIPRKAATQKGQSTSGPHRSAVTTLKRRDSEATPPRTSAGREHSEQPPASSRHPRQI